MASIERIRFFDVQPGSDLIFTTSNAADKINFNAVLVENMQPTIAWSNNEIWNNTAIAVLEDSNRKRLEIQAIFTGNASFDIKVEAISPNGGTTQSAELLGLSQRDLVQVKVYCSMAGA